MKNTCLGCVLKVLLRGWYPAWNTSGPPGEKVNRGENLRWVGSRCPLTRALDSAVVKWVKVKEDIGSVPQCTMLLCYSGSTSHNAQCFYDDQDQFSQFSPHCIIHVEGHSLNSRIQLVLITFWHLQVQNTIVPGQPEPLVKRATLMNRAHS